MGKVESAAGAVEHRKNLSKVTFQKAPPDGFFSTLRKRVDAHFEKTGQSRKANAWMVTKSVIFLGSLGAIYFTSLFVAMPWWAYVGAYTFGGVIVANIGFNIGHDSIHGAYSDKPWVNKAMSKWFDFIGASSYPWSIYHNFVHHTYTNVIGVDDDIEPGSILRFQPNHKTYWFHRYQHIYAWFLYFFTAFVWVFKKDYKQIFTTNPRTGKPHPTKQKVGVFVGKAVHFAILLVTPLLVAPQAWWTVVAGYIGAVAVAGFLLALVFQLAHVVEGPEYPEVGAGDKLDEDWAALQMHTTANFARFKFFSEFFTGGLNHQIEHHLFPKMCHVHYPGISNIVKETAEEFGLPYHEQPTMWAAVKSHYRTLKVLGRGEYRPGPLA